MSCGAGGGAGGRASGEVVSAASPRVQSGGNASPYCHSDRLRTRPSLKQVSQSTIVLAAQSTSDLFPLAFKRLPLATFDRPAGLFARLTWIQTDRPVKYRYTTRTSEVTYCYCSA